MMQHKKEERPAKALPVNSTAIKYGSSLPSTADDWQKLAAHVNGAFVVLVETSHGNYRRRVWLTLAAAERAAIKAQDAGHNAVVVLAELRPLYRVEGAAPKQATLGRIVDAASSEVAV